jgi:enterochelin esterase-like enzyme
VRRFTVSLGPIRISVRTSISVSAKPSSGLPAPAPRRRGWVAVGALLVLGAVLAVAFVGGSAATSMRPVSPPDMGLHASFSPVVRHTGQGPTGYAVTFRYRNPRAKLVQIEGDWAFSSPGGTTSLSSEGLAPLQWRPGDFPINPDQLGDFQAGVKLTWPIVDMKKNPATDVWLYTTPLPSGVFDYSFVVDCTRQQVAPGYTGCPEIPDPANPPWNQQHGKTHGSSVTYSQVYVPSDRAFHTVDKKWEAPTSPRGALADVTYRGTDGPPGLRGKNHLALYTPPGYDPHRRPPYPTLYLSHGYDNNEIDWSTGGDAANILDNLIDSHQIEPMVVVMPQAYWQAPPSPTMERAAASARNLLHTVIPYAEKHYDVSKAASRRAFAGLSFGGVLATSLLLDHTREFASYGVFSPAPFSISSISRGQAAAIKDVRVLVGGGLGDPSHSWATTDLTELQQAGAHPATDFVNGGHDWFVWRTLLRDFLTRVAFKTPRR